MDQEDDDDFPPWLGKAIVNDDLPWQHGSQMTVKEFTKKYSLHDAYWITLCQNVGWFDEATLVLWWSWCGIPCGSFDHPQTPILFVRMQEVQQVSFVRYKDIGGAQRIIAHDEIEEIDNRYVWVIHDMFGGSVEIVFKGKTHFLALNWKKETLII